MAKSTRPRPSGKPTQAKKPRPDFPLFSHATGRWAKKVKGKLHYFGKTADDPNGERALAEWVDQKDNILLTGRKQEAKPEGLTVQDAVNKFLNFKRRLVEAGEITPRTFAELVSTGTLVADQLGRPTVVAYLVAEDFAKLRSVMAKGWGPVRLGNEIQRVRSIFKYAFESGLIDRPVRFGPEFRKPSAKTLRKARAAAGPRMFEAHEMRQIIDAAAVPLKAMVLLAANCGFGPGDLASLPKAALDLDRGWVDFPRPKTGIPRRCPLWPETIAAVRESLAVRPEPKDAAHGELIFLTHWGRPWTRSKESKNGHFVSLNVVAQVFRQLLKKLGINGKRSFYSVRHGFQTVAEEALDMPAVAAIMGHAPRANDMASVYRERIGDTRLKAVVDHVHGWLWPKGEGEKADDAVGEGSSKGRGPK